jgi:TM2 domain-containing membrane protein YozV
MALSTAQLSLIEQRVANDGPSTLVAYLLWFFLGFFSAHRFYLGQRRAGLQILCNLIVIGVIWTLIDAFKIPRMIREKKDAIRQRMMTELMAQGGGENAPIVSAA